MNDDLINKLFEKYVSQNVVNDYINKEYDINNYTIEQVIGVVGVKGVLSSLDKKDITIYLRKKKIEKLIGNG